MIRRLKLKIYDLKYYFWLGMYWQVKRVTKALERFGDWCGSHCMSMKIQTDIAVDESLRYPYRRQR